MSLSIMIIENGKECPERLSADYTDLRRLKARESKCAAV
jgi:hypothetical protein